MVAVAPSWRARRIWNDVSAMVRPAHGSAQTPWLAVVVASNLPRAVNGRAVTLDGQ
jgi:hypothetical protein